MTISRITGKPFPRGARRSPPHKLLAAQPFMIAVAPPQAGYFPKKLNVWGNDTYGDCVTAEEAFAKACANPEIFIDPNIVIAWASKNGYLNGADLAEVLDSMRSNGFVVGGQKYNDGDKLGVDYSNEAILQAAIADPAASGPVKIAIDANALPSGAGNDQGWHAFGGGNYPNTDHCVSVPFYGPALWCCQGLGIPLPSGVAPDKAVYGLYTWATVGLVDHAWLMGTCTEAWTRRPTTVGVPPLPDPGPTPVPPGPTPVPPDPTPVPPPVPQPTGNLAITLSGNVSGPFGHHPVTLTGTATPALSGQSRSRSTGRLQFIKGTGTPTIMAILADLWAILAAVPTGNWVAIEAAVVQLLKDLGLPLSMIGTKSLMTVAAISLWTIFQDVLAIASAYQSGSIPAVEAAVAKLIADLGL